MTQKSETTVKRATKKSVAKSVSSSNTSWKEGKNLDGSTLRYSPTQVIGIFEPKDSSYQTYSIGLSMSTSIERANKRVNLPGWELPSNSYDSKRTYFMNGFKSHEEAEAWIDKYKEDIPNIFIALTESHAPIGVSSTTPSDIAEAMADSQRVVNPSTGEYVLDDGYYRYRQTSLEPDFTPDVMLDEWEDEDSSI